MWSEVRYGKTLIHLEGRIDSNNARDVEAEIEKRLAEEGDKEPAFDMLKLDYVSSAGLRVFLKIRKKWKKNLTLTNVSDEVYSIFEVTGFTEMFDIIRKLRQVSVKDLDPMSTGINGTIYRLPGDEMIKVYNPNVGIREVRYERELAHTALVLGIPTAIPYDVVSCDDDNFGIVFEAMDADSLAQAIKKNPDKIDDYAKEFAAFLHELHGTTVPMGKMPNIKDKYREWLELAKSELSPGDADRLTKLINAIPDKTNYVHGDISLTNVILQDGEMLLLDVASSGRGHTIFDMQGLYASLIAIEKERPYYCVSTFGISKDTCADFWKRFYAYYMEGGDEQKFKQMNALLQQYYILKQKLLMGLQQKSKSEYQKTVMK